MWQRLAHIASVEGVGVHECERDSDSVRSFLCEKKPVFCENTEVFCWLSPCWADKVSAWVIFGGGVVWKSRKITVWIFFCVRQSVLWRVSPHEWCPEGFSPVNFEGFPGYFFVDFWLLGHSLELLIIPCQPMSVSCARDSCLSIASRWFLSLETSWRKIVTTQTQRVIRGVCHPHNNCWLDEEYHRGLRQSCVACARAISNTVFKRFQKSLKWQRYFRNLKPFALGVSFPQSFPL